MKRAIISGATGAVGMALIDQLIREQVEVLVLCRKGSARTAQLPKHPLLCTVEADLEEYGGLSNHTGKKWDVFYHLAWAGTVGAARNDTALQLKNVAHTLDAVRLAARFGCETFIGAGSQAEYGRYEGSLNAEIPAFPETGYGIAKLAAGQMSRLLCGQLNMKHIWVRILSVYGPYDGMQSMVMSAVSSFLDGVSPPFTKGEQRWDYLYSRDAAKAMYLLGEKGKDRKVYCLGSGQARPLKEYIMEIRDAVLPAREIEPRLGEIPYGPGQVMYLCADLKELYEDTGFVPDISFAEGIRNTIEYVKSQRTGETGSRVIAASCSDMED